MSGWGLSGFKNLYSKSVDLIKQVQDSVEVKVKGQGAPAPTVAPHDSHLMTRFKQAGLLNLGRTTTPELGFCSTCESLLTGPSRNPWNTGHMTGGSSGALSMPRS